MTQSVAICTPAYGGMINIQHAQSVMSAAFQLTEAGHELHWLNYGNVASVTKARNAMVAEALDLGATDIVFIDADIAFHHSALQRLLRHDAELVGGIQRQTITGSSGLHPVGDNDTFPFTFIPLEGGQLNVKNGVAEVAAIPTCFMRIRATALRELMDENPHLQYWDGQVAGADQHLYALFDYRLTTHPEHPDRQKYQGEDYAFCELWRASGREIYADLEIPLRHIKTVNLDGAPMNYLRAAP